MATITLPTTFQDNTVPTASQFNGDFNAIVNDYNGGITDANIAAGAAIDVTKLSSSVVSLTGTQTVTNKRITKRVLSQSSGSAPAPDADSYDVFCITALAIDCALGAPTGTPTNGQTLVVRIKDNGTARALSFNAIYRFSTDVPAPTTTVLSKTIYLGFMYNAFDSKWDCLAKVDNF